MLCYLHIQAKPIMQDFTSKMLNHGSFGCQRLIALRRRRDPPTLCSHLLSMAQAKVWRHLRARELSGCVVAGFTELSKLAKILSYHQTNDILLHTCVKVHELTESVRTTPAYLRDENGMTVKHSQYPYPPPYQMAAAQFSTRQI